MMKSDKFAELKTPYSEKLTFIDNIKILKLASDSPRFLDERIEILYKEMRSWLDTVPCIIPPDRDKRQVSDSKWKFLENLKLYAIVDEKWLDRTFKRVISRILIITNGRLVLNPGKKGSEMTIRPPALPYDTTYGKKKSIKPIKIMEEMELKIPIIVLLILAYVWHDSSNVKNGTGSDTYFSKWGTKNKRALWQDYDTDDTAAANDDDNDMLYFRDMSMIYAILFYAIKRELFKKEKKRKDSGHDPRYPFVAKSDSERKYYDPTRYAFECLYVCTLIHALSYGMFKDIKQYDLVDASVTESDVADIVNNTIQAESPYNLSVKEWIIKREIESLYLVKHDEIKEARLIGLASLLVYNFEFFVWHNPLVTSSASDRIQKGCDVITLYFPKPASAFISDYKFSYCFDKIPIDMALLTTSHVYVETAKGGDPICISEMILRNSASHNVLGESLLNHVFLTRKEKHKSEYIPKTISNYAKQLTVLLKNVWYELFTWMAKASEGGYTGYNFSTSFYGMTVNVIRAIKKEEKKRKSKSSMGGFMYSRGSMYKNFNTISANKRSEGKRVKMLKNYYETEGGLKNFGIMRKKYKGEEYPFIRIGWVLKEQFIILYHFDADMGTTVFTDGHRFGVSLPGTPDSPVFQKRILPYYMMTIDANIQNGKEEEEEGRKKFLIGEKTMVTTAPDHKEKIKVMTCPICGMKNTQSYNDKMMKTMKTGAGVCSGCDSVYYCSTTCQLKDWKNGHYKKCGKSSK